MKLHHQESTNLLMLTTLIMKYNALCLIILLNLKSVCLILTYLPQPSFGYGLHGISFYTLSFLILCVCVCVLTLKVYILWIAYGCIFLSQSKNCLLIKMGSFSTLNVMTDIIERKCTILVFIFCSSHFVFLLINLLYFID